MTGAEARVVLADVDSATGDVAWSLMDSSTESGALHDLSTQALIEVCDRTWACCVGASNCEAGHFPAHCSAV